MKNNRRKFLQTAGLATAGLVFSSGFSLTPTSAEKNTPEKIKPPRLKVGDTVAITSPAGALWDNGKTVDAFTQVLQKLGFKVIHGSTLRKQYGYFAGTDEERAKELNEFFANPKVRGIFCAKGGWGSARLLDKLDFSIIENNPKVLVGFSDITTLLNAIHVITGLITFHGPVGNSSWNAFTNEYFVSVAMHANKISFIHPENKTSDIIVFRPGVCEGELVGGNLTVLTAMLGTGYIPDFKNKILFLEEAHEEPYSIDRMLTQLKMSGVLNSVQGIVFGKCTECEAEEPQKSFTVQEVLQQHFSGLSVPVMVGSAFGHVENKWTLPIGIKAELNTADKSLRLIEAAVS